MPTQLVVGDVTYTDTSPSVQVDPSPGTFGDYQIRNHYERDGLSFAGSNTTAEPFAGAQVSVVTLGCPLLYWLCEWTACKVGGEPEIPDPTPADGNWTLLDVHVTPAMQSLGPDGESGVFRVSGCYVYVRRIASPDVFRDVCYPRAPWVREGALSRKIPLSKLKRGLSDVTGTGSAASQPNGGATIYSSQGAGQGALGVVSRVNQG